MPKPSSTSVRVFYPKFDTPWLVATLSERIGELNRLLPLRLVVLFGSYARGNYTVASDVDLLVIYKGELREDAFGLVKKTLRIPQLEPHLYSEEEYRQHERIIQRMKAGGKVIYDEGQSIAGYPEAPCIDG